MFLVDIVNKTKKGQVLPDSALRQQFVSANGSLQMQLLAASASIVKMVVIK
jgi:hypothetical protein